MPLDLAMTRTRTAVGDVMNPRSSVGTQLTLYGRNDERMMFP